MNTTTATTGNGKFGRWATAAVLAVTLGMGLAAPAAAQYQRVYPQRNNPQLVDIYYNGRWVQRVDTSQPGWIFELRADVRAPLSWVKYPANRPISPDTTYYLLNNQQWVTLPQLQMAQAMSNRQRQPNAGEQGTIGGFGSGSSGSSSPLYSGTLGGFSSGSSGSSGPLYSGTIGGVTAASQRTATQRRIDAALEAARQRSIEATLAPDCNRSYLGCR